MAVMARALLLLPERRVQRSGERKCVYKIPVSNSAVVGCLLTTKNSFGQSSAAAAAVQNNYGHGKYIQRKRDYGYEASTLVGRPSEREHNTRLNEKVRANCGHRVDLLRRPYS